MDTKENREIQEKKQKENLNIINNSEKNYIYLILAALILTLGGIVIVCILLFNARAPKTSLPEQVTVTFYALYIGPSQNGVIHYQLIDATINDKHYGGNQQIDCEAGYSTRYTVNEAIKPNTSGFVWADKVNKRAVGNYLKELGFHSFSIKTESDNRIDQEDNRKDIFCCLKSGNSDIAHVSLSMPVDCDLLITDESLKTKLPVIKFRDGIVGANLELYLDHFYIFYVKPINPFFRESLFSFYYRGENAGSQDIKIRLYQDYLKEWNETSDNKAQAKLMAEIKRKIESDHPDYNTLISSFSSLKQ